MRPPGVSASTTRRSGPPREAAEGARIAVWTIVNIEEWDIEQPMARQYLTAPQGVATVPDVPNWAWHEYGMRVGFWRLSTRSRTGKIRATTAINAHVCQFLQPVAQATLKRAGSSWAMVSSRARRKADDQRPRSAAVTVCRNSRARSRKGWLGPGPHRDVGDARPPRRGGHRIRLDWVNDDQPYEIKTTAGAPGVVPLHARVNDIPMMVIQHHTSSEWVEAGKDQFDRLYAEGGRTRASWRSPCTRTSRASPHRIKYFEAVYDYIGKKQGVWLTTGEETPARGTRLVRERV